MSLDNFYRLRNNFLVVGLTGRTGGGCNDICEFLSADENPFLKTDFIIPNNLHINEIQKFTICKNILTDQSNAWHTFSIIRYRDILLLFFLSQLYENTDKDFATLELNKTIEVFNKLYNSETVETRRIGQQDEMDGVVEKGIFPFLASNKDILNKMFGELDMKDVMFNNISEADSSDRIRSLNDFYFNNYSRLAKEFFEVIDKIDPVGRQLFMQDIACNLRCSGQIYFTVNQGIDNKVDFIFIVAEVIKRFIKINHKANGTNNQKTRIVVDSLKNSLEINYFRERYSGFYLIASNREEEEIQEYLKAKMVGNGFGEEKARQIVEGLKSIDSAHYKTSDFKQGEFTTPDIENCIQKADYYIYLDKPQESEPVQYNPTEYRYLSLKLQMLKFLALIYKPGIVTPSALERSMQLAFSSKYNSGCISRQVGAVVTDSNYSVKSVGWNEVPQGQTPCTLRNLKELVNSERTHVYSDYEREGGNYNGQTFKQKVNETLIAVYGQKSNFFNNLNGHNCPYCFKDFHNAFEGKENQVHTRSLHAEENAMLQISKYGGQPLNGGILFTTASPCELCSKKAFQLGIVKIFYIDPYPGIAKQQILKAGNDTKKNPQLYMFQGAVGRGYFKLYEPYMSIKDETHIRTGIKPKTSEEQTLIKTKDQLLEKFATNKDIKDKIKSISTYDELASVIERGLTPKL